MATLDKIPSALMAHRRWEDILSMILGAAIMISPMVIDATATPTVIAITGVVGAAIFVLGALEQLSLRRWEEFLSLLCGIWVMVSPFVLNYGGMLRNWHIALGACVALLALLELWQDRDRQLGM